MNYFIREFLGSKIMIVVKTVIIFHPLFEILRDPLWGPQDRPPFALCGLVFDHCPKSPVWHSGQKWSGRELWSGPEFLCPS